jgi:hypothetical protein
MLTKLKVQKLLEMNLRRPLKLASANANRSNSSSRKRIRNSSLNQFCLFKEETVGHMISALVVSITLWHLDLISQS